MSNLIRADGNVMYEPDSLIAIDLLNLTTGQSRRLYIMVKKSNYPIFTQISNFYPTNFSVGVFKKKIALFSRYISLFFVF